MAPMTNDINIGDKFYKPGATGRAALVTIKGFVDDQIVYTYSDDSWVVKRLTKFVDEYKRVEPDVMVYYNVYTGDNIETIGVAHPTRLHADDYSKGYSSHRRRTHILIINKTQGTAELEPV